MVGTSGRYAGPGGTNLGFSETLSDIGEHTGRGSGLIRGTITGAATTLGGAIVLAIGVAIGSA